MVTSCPDGGAKGGACAGGVCQAHRMPGKTSWRMCDGSGYVMRTRRGRAAEPSFPATRSAGTGQGLSAATGPSSSPAIAAAADPDAAVGGAVAPDAAVGGATAVRERLIADRAERCAESGSGKGESRSRAVARRSTTDLVELVGGPGRGPAPHGGSPRTVEQHRVCLASGLRGRIRAHACRSVHWVSRRARRPPGATAGRNGHRGRRPGETPETSSPAKLCWCAVTNCGYLSP